MMRQAGRYCRISSLCVINMIFHRCQTPELAAGTVQPIRRIAQMLLFYFGYIGNSTSMGIEVEMKPNFGPYLQILFTIQDVEKVIVQMFMKL
jgi:uroporphyrinogen decarboxylase